MPTIKLEFNEKEFEEIQQLRKFLSLDEFKVTVVIEPEMGEEIEAVMKKAWITIMYKILRYGIH